MKNAWDYLETLIPGKSAEGKGFGELIKACDQEGQGEKTYWRRRFFSSIS